MSRSNLVCFSAHDIILFFQTFNSVCRISEVLIELQQHGHDQYMGWEMKVCCRANDIVNRLGEQAKIMEEDLNNWRDTIRDERGNFYHLNYFTTQQLLSLREELGCFKEGRADRPIKPEIMALLQSVSLDITPQNVKDSLFNIIAILGEQTALDESSEEYVKAIQDSVTHKANRYNESLKNNLAADSIKLSIQSNKKTLNATQVLKNIVVNDDISQPQLSIDDLTDNQKTILANVKQTYSLHTKHVLLAFDRCAKADDEDVVVEWCLEHSEDFPYPDSDEETASTTSYDDDDHDSITSDSPSHTTTMDYSVPPTKTDSSAGNRKINARIHIRQHVPIDEHHQTVIDLVEAGFDLEQSIKAASKYPNDPSAAIDYLDDSNIEEGGSLFQSIVTAEELFGESSLSSIVEPVVHSDGFGLEEESVPVFTQRQDSSMSDTSQTL